jgi:hypothetical protein
VAKPDRELRGINARLSDLADAVLEGHQDRGNAAVAGQRLNTHIRAVGVELKACEQTEFIERLEVLWLGWAKPATRTGAVPQVASIERGIEALEVAYAGPAASGAGEREGSSANFPAAPWTQWRA